MRDRERLDPAGRESGAKGLPGRIEKGGIIIRIYYVRKGSISSKRKERNTGRKVDGLNIRQQGRGLNST